MKKRFFAVLLLAVLLAMSMAQAAWAATVASGECGAEGDNVTWVLDDAGTLTISGTGEMKDYSTETGDFNVNLTAAPWYLNNRGNLSQVIIQNGVTNIGDYAFYYCSNLNSIIIPDSIASIGNGALAGCDLISITLPDGITSIGSNAFNNCRSLTNINMPKSLTNIGSHVFYNCENLTEFKIPENWTEIKSGTFSGCKSLIEITIPDSVTTIKNNAFYGCISLTSIIVPDDVTSIDAYAFRACTNLTSIDIPANVKFIGTGAFADCSNLKDVFFQGTKSTWDKVNIKNENEPLLNANIHYLGIDEPSVAVTGVTLNQQTAALKVGETVNLFETVLPDNATNKEVVWSTDNPAVATVGKEIIHTTAGGVTASRYAGQVKAVGAGTATADGGKTAACTVTVTQPATGVTLNYSEISLLTGGTAQLQATVSEGASNKNVLWTSSKPEVAAVDTSGKVTALTAGQAVITATAADGSGQKAECEVTVTGTAAPAEAIYTITFDTDGGTMAGPSFMQVTKETKVTMPTAEKSGYNFKYWQDVANSSQTYAANNVYSFAADTELKAIWERRSSGGSSGGGGSRPATKPGTTTETKPSTESNKPGNSGSKEITAANIGTVFGDVQNNAWYSEAIAYVYNKGMMNGTEKGFEPNSATTRAMIVTMLHRLNGTPAAGVAGFADVAGGQWYSEAVAWAAANGVVNGYSDTKFAPNEEITREQLAAILYRYAQFKGLDVSAKGDLSGFADGAAVSGWAQEAMQWAVGAGLLNGNADGTLASAAGATRAEVAMILMRFEGAVK